MAGKSKYLQKNKLVTYLLDNIPDVVYFKDRQGEIIFVNKAYVKGAGVKAKDILGKTDFDFFPKRRAEKMAKDDAFVIKTGKSIVDKVERATRVDGADNYVSTTKMPIFDSKGKVQGLMGVTRDITHRVQIEKIRKEREDIARKLAVMESMDKVKAEFISAVSHELRTPLATVKQLVMLLLDDAAGEINDKQREVLRRANNNVERLKTLVDDLLDISRIESGKMRLKYSLVGLNGLFSESADFFRGLAKGKDIKLTYRLLKEDINVFVDPERINQVISNLITNAVKYTETGGSITVGVKILETKIQVGVIDTGVGISQQDLPYVFDKFVQVYKGIHPSRKGLGLGLAITKELVEKHGGEIWVKSRAGVGSEFYFTIPRFYTSFPCSEEVKLIIAKFYRDGVPAQFINMNIVNYGEFKERIKIKPERFFSDLKKMALAERENIECYKKEKLYPVVVTDIINGRVSMIFPGITEEEAGGVYIKLSKNIKGYFFKHKMDNVFIALGMFSSRRYLSQDFAEGALAKSQVREVYIGAEMRRFPRIAYKTKIKVVFPDESILVFYTVDISEGGLCFVSDRTESVDSNVSVKFTLLRTREVITTTGRVAWVKHLEAGKRKEPYNYLLGVEFTALTKKDKNALFKEFKW